MNVQSIDKKERIFQATLRLLTIHGFHGTTMSMIWKEAGVAAGTIYHYFQNKEELIEQIYTRCKQEMGEAMTSKISDGEYQDQFAAFCRALFYHFINKPDNFLFLEQYANSPHISQSMKENNKHFYELVIEFLDSGIEKGVFKPLPVQMITGLVYSSISACVKLHITGELTITKELLDKCILASWDALVIK